MVDPQGQEWLGSLSASVQLSWKLMMVPTNRETVSETLHSPEIIEIHYQVIPSLCSTHSLETLLKKTKPSWCPKSCFINNLNTNPPIVSWSLTLAKVLLQGYGVVEHYRQPSEGQSAAITTQSEHWEIEVLEVEKVVIFSDSHCNLL